MNYLKVSLISLAIAASGVILYVLFSQGNFPNKQNDLVSNSTSSTSLISLLPQINSEGEVTVKVSPQDLSQFAISWDFEVLLDTHSGNLDQDLIKNSVLTNDTGDQFTPISWEGNSPQGHHRQGILKFQPISLKPTSISLRISKIGDVAERRFKWEL